MNDLSYQDLLERSQRAIEFYQLCFQLISDTMDSHPVFDTEINESVRKELLYERFQDLLHIAIEDDLAQVELPPGLASYIARRGHVVKAGSEYASSWFSAIGLLRKKALARLSHARRIEQTKDLLPLLAEGDQRYSLRIFEINAHYHSIVSIHPDDLPTVMSIAADIDPPLRRINAERLIAEVEVELLSAEQIQLDQSSMPKTKVKNVAPIFRAPSCPACESLSTRTRKTDGQVRYCECRVCQHRWCTEVGR